MQKTGQLSKKSLNSSTSLLVAPTEVLRGKKCLSEAGEAIAQLGNRPLVVGGDRTLSVAEPHLKPVFDRHQLSTKQASYYPDCSETSLANLKKAVEEHRADLIIGAGGGKALDTAKLVAHHCQLPIVTIPTSAATCAAWASQKEGVCCFGYFLGGPACVSGSNCCR